MNNIDELKRFIYSATVTSGSGSQSFYIDAKSREEADARAANNESDGMYADDSEVTDLDALDYEDETTVDDFGDFPLISREQSLIAQLEAAQKRGDDIDENRKVAFELYQNTVNKLEAANEKLSKPIVLPAGYSVRAGHPINEGERNVMIPKEGGRWLSRLDVEHAIRVAGFTVEGE
ncbi:hypothetical protein DVP68_23625 [Yersinia enterocolitica]|nr:hypothetical protein [Yersinia enterocolitica]EKN6369490.1 hypothetical protein [Yersinia enterocolitica]